MTKVIYEIVEHDGGWAYRSNGVYSETFPTYDAARRVAERVIKEQQLAGETESISYEDRDGKWHTEVARGDDRPEGEIRG